MADGRDDRPPLHVARRSPLSDAGSHPAAPFPLLVVHGAMDRASSFSRVTARLPEATVVGYDRRGYGHTTHPGSDRFDDHVDDLFDVVGDEPVVALGHSFGGGVVLAAAARRPDLVRAAVVWEAPMPWLAWWPRRPASGDDPADVAEAFMRRMVGDRIWEHLPSATRAKRRSEGAALLADLRAIGGPAPWDPSSVDVPILVGTGSRSVPHHARAAAELAAALPRGRLVTVAGAGHGAHLSHPAAVVELIREAERLAAGMGAVSVHGAESPHRAEAPAEGGSGMIDATTGAATAAVSPAAMRRSPAAMRRSLRP